LKQLLLLFWIFLCAKLSAQTTISILDSATQLPLAGVSIIVTRYPNIHFTDIEGRSTIPHMLSSKDTISISHLGYQKQIISAIHLKENIYLTQRRFILPPVLIHPVNPKLYLQRAFDSFYVNHLPAPYSQKVFYREEFIVNDHYARFQEMDIEVYQFPKTNDSRKFYISGSYPKVHRFYKKDDSLLMKDIKASLGKIAGKQLNYNYLSGYSYVKGVNMLNFIFTHLLEDKNIEYKYLGMENIKGYNSLHIQGKFYQDKINYSNIDIFLEENSYAVLHVSIQATDENLTKQFLDFKTRTILWLLGVKIDVKKYYSKIQFVKTKQGFWAVDDFMLLLPVTIKKKKKLDIYLNIGYRMSPNLLMHPSPIGYSVYQKNQYLFDTQKIGTRFSEKLDYGIPFLPAQQERLERMRH
jgi:hypothetical protein